MLKWSYIRDKIHYKMTLYQCNNIISVCKVLRHKMHSKFSLFLVRLFCIFLHLSFSKIYLTACPFIKLLFGCCVFWWAERRAICCSYYLAPRAPPPPAPGPKQPLEFIYLYKSSSPPPSIRLSSLHFPHTFRITFTTLPPPPLFFTFLFLFSFSTPFALYLSWNF